MRYFLFLLSTCLCGCTAEYMTSTLKNQSSEVLMLVDDDRRAYQLDVMSAAPVGFRRLDAAPVGFKSADCASVNQVVSGFRFKLIKPSGEVLDYYLPMDVSFISANRLYTPWYSWGLGFRVPLVYVDGGAIYVSLRDGRRIKCADGPFRRLSSLRNE